MTDLLDRLEVALCDRYAIERELGSGGMATVYLAHDLKHHRNVAVKVLRQELAAALGSERFLREIEITANLNHPHILPLLDSGEADGFLFYVMPYVEGESLRDRLKREKQLPIDDALKIAREIADGLDFAHDHNVVHRDIKPENILLEAGHAVVADFGVARAISEAGTARLTETGIAIGTPWYMSPEQATGVVEVDGRSDIYSLACVLYELLGGDPPFTGSTPQAILARKTVDTPQPIRSVRDTVPAGVEAALLRALARSPVDRFARASQFADALIAGVERLPATRPTVGFGRQPRWQIGAVLAVVIVVAAAVTWVLSGRSRSTEDPWQRVAVLPVSGRLDALEEEALLVGLHESLTDELAMAGVTVVAPRSVRNGGLTNQPLRSIASRLGVDALFDVSVGGTVASAVVRMRLIDCESEAVLWAGRYEGDMPNVTQVARHLVDDFVSWAGTPLTQEQVARLATVPAIDSEAHKAYLMGRHQLGDFSRDGLWQAAEYFQRALAIEPGYAAAWSGLSDVYTWLGHWFVPDREAAPFALEAARRAVALDPMLAEAHTSLAHAIWEYEWNWEGAELGFKRALELNPASALAHSLYGAFLASAGRFDEAQTHMQLGHDLDPISPSLSADVSTIAVLAGERESAITRLRQVAQVFPNSEDVRKELALALTRAGRYEGALEVWNELEHGPPVWFYGLAGDTGRARALVAELEVDANNAFDVARTYAAVGEPDRALDWLDSAATQLDRQIVWVRVYPELASLHGHPRFGALLRRINYPRQ